jgi:hypothetical protein
MKVDINYQVPERCKDCKFIQRQSEDFGRTRAFVCSLTMIGDSCSEGAADDNRSERRMRKECPFL